MPDSIHELSFDGFELSTKDSILNFKNFKIKARDDIDANSVFQKENQNVYDIDVPTLELKGINYLKAYEDNFLVVNQVNIPKPRIKIQSVLKSNKQNTEQAENSIGASLLALFDLIKIKDFKIHEGGLNLTLKGDNQQRFLSDNISIDLFNIELDSTQRDIQNIIHYFQHASVEINDYDYLLPDNLHTIKFKKLNFNTLDSTLLVQNLEIKPSRNLEDSSLIQFNLNLPLLEMEGIAHRDIYDNDRINLKSLVLRNSSITITPPYLKKSSESRAMVSPQKLSEIVGNYFNEIKLQNFSVLNTDVKVGSILTGKSLNIQSHFLKIDSSFTSWHTIADSTLINGQELLYKLKNGQLTVSTFHSENNLHSLAVSDFNYIYNNISEQVKVDYLSIKGLQLDSILNRKKIAIDSIALFKPMINLSYTDLKQQSKEQNQWEFPAKPINLFLQQGNLKYQLDKFRNVQIEEFDLELNYNNELKLFQIVAKDLRLEDDKLKHQLLLAEIELPKNQSQITLTNLQVKPYKLNDSVSIAIQVPEIKFIGVNKDALIKNKSFEADSMLSRITQLNYKGLSDVSKYFGFKSDSKSEYSFNVKNAKIDLVGSSIILVGNENRRRQIRTSNTKVSVRNLSFPKNDKQALQFVDNFTLENERFDFYSSENDTISLENLSYNGFTSSSQLEKFSFIGADRTTSLTIGGIQMKNAEMKSYIKNNEINIHELNSASTSISLKIKEEGNKKIPQRIEMPFQSLKIQKLQSNDINIKLFYEEKKRNYFVRNADLKINGLTLDSTLSPKEIHRHVNSLVFSGKTIGKISENTIPLQQTITLSAILNPSLKPITLK